MCAMRVEPTRPFYTKNELKREIKTAALSAGLSAGVTLALNRGNVKVAARTGALAAGISVALGVIFKMVNNSKAKKGDNNQNELKN